MEKEFLDFLYEKRTELQRKIDGLCDREKDPISQCCDEMQHINKASIELNEVREHIYSINKTIEKYLSIHKNK